MSKLPANLTRIYLDQFNISGDLNGWNQAVQQETPVVTALSDTGPRRLVGNYDHNDGYLGYFDGVDNAIDEIMHALLGSASDHYYCKVLANSLSSDLPAEGSIVYESILHLTEKPLSGQVGGAVLLNLSGAGANGVGRGVVLRSQAGSLLTGSGQNLGATTSGQTFFVVFRVLSVTGSGTIVLRVQESANDGSPDTYADIAGLTATFTGVGVERDTTTAATEAWKRLSVNTFSGFTAATILVTVGVMPA